MLKRWLQTITLTDVVVWAIGLIIGIAVIYGTISTLRAGIYSTTQWIDLIIGGLKLGGIYALIALGYTLVYGILRMINFAHSEVFMSGPFTAVFLAKFLHAKGFYNSQPIISLLLITILSVGVAIGIALMLERIAYRPLRNAPRLVPLITAIGASFFLQYTFRGLYGNDLESYPTMKVLQGKLSLGIIQIQRADLIVIIAAFIMMLLLYIIVQYTKMGKAMRSVSEDKETAALMGIDVDRMISMTFMIGGAAAGAAGVLYAIMFKQVHFFMGFIPGIKAFTAAVLGGIGNIPGAMLGGIFLGLVESVGPSLFLDGLGIVAPYQLKDAIAFTMLVLVLIFRPSGILGERLAVKKA